jgi:SPP1 family predicted phage head-tail adaptor
MRTLFIDPGMLSHELVLEEPVETPDGAGGFTIVWNGLGTIWARLEPLNPETEIWAGRDPSEQTHRVTLRHRTGVRQGMCFRKLTRLFPILAVQDADETGRYLICRTREETE